MCCPPSLGTFSWLKFSSMQWQVLLHNKTFWGLAPQWFKSATHTLLFQFLKGNCSLFIPCAPPAGSLPSHSHSSKTEREMSSTAGAMASREDCPMTTDQGQHAGIWCDCLLLAVWLWGFHRNGSLFLESVGLSLQGLWRGQRAVGDHAVWWMLHGRSKHENRSNHWSLQDWSLVWRRRPSRQIHLQFTDKKQMVIKQQSKSPLVLWNANLHHGKSVLWYISLYRNWNTLKE